MKKFTKLLENSYIKYYEVSAEIKLVFSAQSYGEAGYLADSELGSIESQTDFRISDISEITKEEYQKVKITESVDSKDITAEQKIEADWKETFDNRVPSKTEEMEFYHQMRLKKFDGILVLQVIDKIKQSI